MIYGNQNKKSMNDPKPFLNLSFSLHNFIKHPINRYILNNTSKNPSVPLILKIIEILNNNILRTNIKIYSIIFFF